MYINRFNLGTDIPTFKILCCSAVTGIYKRIKKLNKKKSNMSDEDEQESESFDWEIESKETGLRYDSIRDRGVYKLIEDEKNYSKINPFYWSIMYMLPEDK